MSDTPKAPTPAIRRAEGGARQVASRRVQLFVGERELSGWTLNLSRGGARIIVVDEELPVAAELACEIAIDGDENGRRPALVIWVQTEADGQILGIKYLDVEGTIPPQSMGTE